MCRTLDWYSVAMKMVSIGKWAEQFVYFYFGYCQLPIAVVINIRIMQNTMFEKHDHSNAVTQSNCSECGSLAWRRPLSSIQVDCALFWCPITYFFEFFYQFVSTWWLHKLRCLVEDLKRWYPLSSCLLRASCDCFHAYLSRKWAAGLIVRVWTSRIFRCFGFSLEIRGGNDKWIA